LATKFRSEKIPRNRLGTASVIPRKKVLFLRHSEVYGRVYSEARNGRNGMKTISFTKNPAPANIIDSIFHLRHTSERNSELFSLPRNGSDQNFDCLHLILFYSKEFRAIFSSVERFGTEFREFLFRGKAGITPEQTNCSVYSVFRGIIFLSEIANPRDNKKNVTLIA
jgi:hypothetical protein